MNISVSFLWGLVLLIFVVFFGIFWAIKPLNPFLSHYLDVFDVKTSPRPFTGKLRVMSYNIAFGGGLKNLDGRAESKDVVLKNLDAVTRIIKDQNPDVLGVQEIDLNSHRSYGINQVEYIAQACGFKYVAVAFTWNKRWVPFPIFAFFSRQFGSVLAANVVFSKYPILSQDIVVFDKPENASWIYKQFYLDRLVQYTLIDFKQGKTLLFANTHLEAFNSKTRVKQASLLAGYIHEHYSNTPLVLSGDFNAVDAQSDLDKGADFNIVHDDTLSIIEETTGLKRAHFLPTFPSDSPFYGIDHVFYSSRLTLKRHTVLPDPNYGSDHLAVLAEFNF